ncbi:hypothetical protein MPDQ_002086 [Monascus purpureus]|uniref:Endoplasmic reticulum transmembrane protein n=1 Tax=Monascus purpureus TaxID=5098 RepID=A0A507QL60_MONPU|nr:hypothetical protein MPDQ_002086 [Monascus purpureus]
MTLYYTLVFVLLVFEMAVFLGLIIPLPFAARRKLFNFISESPIITFIFILILFIDSVNRVYRVQLDVAALHREGGSAGRAAAIGTDRAEIQARKFYSQRNMYLCGFTLFLSLILNRTYILMLDVLRLEDKVKTLEGSKKAGVKDASEISSLKKQLEAKDENIAALKKELEKKNVDIETLKKQSEGLAAEYNKLGDQISPKTDEARKSQ